MKCQGKFKFKTLTKRDGGSFINAKGENIKYNGSYALKVDEVVEDQIYERLFKVPLESELVPQLINTKPYEDIIIEFDVQISASSIKLVPMSIKK